jgi:hypothetical protein
LHFIKMYLAMEEWFHDCNDKDGVNVYRGEISKVLSALQKIFPRSAHTNGYSIPNMHGMTKMQSYKVVWQWYKFLWWSWGAAHKTFVKSAQKTQRKVSKFAQQTAHQCYYMMLSSCAVQHLTECSSRLVQVGRVEVSNEDMIHMKHQENDDHVQVLLSGQYEIDVLQAVINEMQLEHTVTFAWLTENTDKNNNLKHNLCKDLVRCLHRKIIHSEEAISKIIGYTRAIVTSNSSNERSIFYSHPCYQGEEWYNWAMVHFEETNPFLGKI